MTFKVMAERCNQCLFGKDKIVSDRRRAQILRDLRRNDSHFICHKASIAGQDIACHGDWEQNGCGQLGRIMGRLGGVEFVPDPTLTTGPAAAGNVYRRPDPTRPMPADYQAGFHTSGA